MMLRFKRIHVSLFVIATLQFTAAWDSQSFQGFMVRAGDDVSLPCEKDKDGQQGCELSTWTFTGQSSGPVTLVTLDSDTAQSDRMRITKSCSLSIKKVSAQDAGSYVCRHYMSGRLVTIMNNELSVVVMTENNDQRMLICSVETGEPCKHTVKWLVNGTDVTSHTMTSESSCFAFVTFDPSDLMYESKLNSSQCEVTDGLFRKAQQFPFRRRPSGEKPGEKPGGDAIKPPTQPPTTRTATRKRTTPTTTPTTTPPTTRTPPTTSTPPITRTATRKRTPPTTSTPPTTRTAAAATEVSGTTDTSKATEIKPSMDCHGCSAVDLIMLVLRVAELGLITVITVLLVRAGGKQRRPDEQTVYTSMRGRRARRSGAAAAQVNREEDEGDDEVKYENFGDSSASVRLH